MGNAEIFVIWIVSWDKDQFNITIVGSSRKCFLKSIMLPIFSPYPFLKWLTLILIKMIQPSNLRLNLSFVSHVTNVLHHFRVKF